MKYIADQKLKYLFNTLAELTKKKCESDCKTGLGSCCSAEYCEMAKEYAAEQGIGLVETRNAEGCLVEPWLRPLCTLHACERHYTYDPVFAKEYFDLRDAIDAHVGILLKL